ncbi:uncharacterized protein MCYG_04378 [Microsporum canis CBS 113480]|uniref:Uncharacterized protein n=1 Tax=Arthroderma otae (strain ATCC MYA-4605 / CBS 113480) TaxID=554155 RepID=C5FNE5_ARTOC|nr:uncharacterized protein MCYG_04378 [Microsporum canis CBS 113480]EEQ31559.1 predicted protein [Microsporum canis CBS 113480]
MTGLISARYSCCEGCGEKGKGLQIYVGFMFGRIVLPGVRRCLCCFFLFSTIILNANLDKKIEYDLCPRSINCGSISSLSNIPALPCHAGMGKPPATTCLLHSRISLHTCFIFCFFKGGMHAGKWPHVDKYKHHSLRGGWYIGYDIDSPTWHNQRVAPS